MLHETTSPLDLQAGPWIGQFHREGAATAASSAVREAGGILSTSIVDNTTYFSCYRHSEHASPLTGGLVGSASDMAPTSILGMPMWCWLLKTELRKADIAVADTDAYAAEQIVLRVPTEGRRVSPKCAGGSRTLPPPATVAAGNP